MVFFKAVMLVMCLRSCRGYLFEGGASVFILGPRAAVSSPLMRFSEWKAEGRNNSKS